MYRHFALETHFQSGIDQRVYWFTRPDPMEYGFYKHVIQLSVFFHRSAKDRKRYNVTNIRQFTCHQENEIDFYSSVMGIPLIREEIQCKDINDFFNKIGFDYKTKTYISGERIKKWNNKLNIFV